jgi:hypothetical protein
MTLLTPCTRVHDPDRGGERLSEPADGRGQIFTGTENEGRS